MSPTPIEEDPEFIAYADRVLTELVPKIESSALTISVVPEGPSDVKFAIELGMSIMLDKPIILAVRPGAEVPEHLTRVADAIVEIGPNMLESVEPVLRRLGVIPE